MTLHPSISLVQRNLRNCVESKYQQLFSLCVRKAVYEFLINWLFVVSRSYLWLRSLGITYLLTPIGSHSAHVIQLTAKYAAMTITLILYLNL